jgi:hypothetical protein
MYVLNAGPSIWSAFHVIGTVFDKAVTDNGVATHAPDRQPGGRVPVRHARVR